MKKLSLLAGALLVAIAGIYVWQSREAHPQTQEDAIRQAQEYKPDGICTQALVPAVHKATGATYTFGSGCLAPGWERQ